MVTPMANKKHKEYKLRGRLYMNKLNFSNSNKNMLIRKKTEIRLATIPNSPDEFTCGISGDTDVLAKCLLLV